LEAVDSQVTQRRKGEAVRLEIEAGAHPEIVERPVSTFELDESLVFRVHGPVNLQRLFHLYEETPRADLKYPPWVPRQAVIGRDADSMFEAIRRQDALLHHPYDSYDAVVRFLETAAHDPRVLSIKQTIYRTNSNSPIARALLEAADKKEVTVVVELKASFDEATNIRWARSFEDAGVQVFHGLVGLKTHAKLALIVRQDPDGKIRRYAHLGTGNYNPSTARYYTDLSLLTRNEAITSAVHDVFNYLTAYAEQKDYKPLLVAPRDMAKTCIGLIEREGRHARRGRPARIIVKVNAIVDPPILSSYLADTRKARLLGPDATYSRPRAVRNGHGFSAQEHLMRLAGAGDTPRNAFLRGSAVVYTSKDVTAGAGSSEADNAAQDSSNAAV
jgi:polyphosphate kinase